MLAAAVLTLAGFLPTEGRAQTLQPSWTQQSPANNPGGRFESSLTYDAAHGQVVLFSGNSASADTWLWNGTNWTQANPANSPSARYNPAMVYDAAHGQVVLFGGTDDNTNTRLGDTWVWDGTNWTEVSTTGPTGRNGAVMVYDATNHNVVLFGGIDDVTGYQQDTWIWNGSSWAVQTPPNYPSARADYSMVYDAAMGEVLLFGGEGASGYFNDTWVWNGTTWSPVAVSAPPPARLAQGMAYHPTLGQVVMFGGYNGSYLDDTWVWNGITWTPAATPNGLTPRIDPNGMTYDSALDEVILFSGFAQDTDTWEWGLPKSLSNVNVCPTSQTTPAPCSATLTLTYAIPSAMTLGATQVVTQGASGQDFSLGSGSTCSGALAPGTCTVNVNFTPLSPGTRAAAVNLVDSGGNVLASSPLSGVGQAPEAAIGPGVQSTVSTGATSLRAPSGVTLDAAGNLYLADYATSEVIKIAPNQTQTIYGPQLPTPLIYPWSTAVDGAGNLYIADYALSAIVKIPVGCSSTCPQEQILPNPLGINNQDAVAVDGFGNVFYAGYASGTIVEIPANGQPQFVVRTGAPGSTVYGLAIDSAGDLFATDYKLSQVVEIPIGCTVAACQQTIGSGWINPEGVAVDAAGDVYVTDNGLQSVVEIPAGCLTNTCQIQIASGISSFGVGLDAGGDVYIADAFNSLLLEFNRSQPPAISFATTAVGSTSSDSPRSVTLINVGNQPLIAQSPGLITVNGPNFANVSGSGTPADCSSSYILSPGQACNQSISFQPQAGGPLSSTAVFADNSLNNYPATQTLSLTGTGATTSLLLSVAVIGNGSGAVTDSQSLIDCAEAGGVAANGNCSANYAPQTLVTLTAMPAGTSAFLGWGGACAGAGTSLTCTLLINQVAAATASFANQSFGNVNVCPSGQTTPAPCSSTMPLAFNLASTTTIGAIQVVTQGVSGLDFSLGSGSTCTGTVTGGSSCSVNVTFTPLAPGLRMGAIEIFDNNANLVQSTPIYGIGQQPLIAFSPTTQSTLNTSTYPLNQAKGLTVDAAGDVFIADTLNQRVVKVAPNGAQSLIGTGFQYPQGLAVDGAGDVFVADNNLNEVIEVPAGCTNVNCQFPVGSGLAAQLGVAVDGPGNLYIGDFTGHEVVEVPVNGGPQIVLYNPGPNSEPVGVAVDAAGDLFVADYGLKSVVEVPFGCTTTNCQITLGSGWQQPDSVAVDAAGNVYVADFGLSEVVEIPAGCSTCQIVIASGIQTVAAAVDWAGNVFISNEGTNQIVKVSRSQPPSLSFALTNAGNTSVDSPQLVSVQNLGNQTLSGSVVFSLGTSFSQNPGSTCGSGFSLTPGASCTESFSFMPQSTGYFSGTATFSDNTGNLSPLVVAQTVSLSGSGGTNGQPVTVAVPNVTGMTQAAAVAPITNAGLVLGTVSTASSQSVPAGSVIDQTPESPTQVSIGSTVSLLVSTGLPQPTAPNPLSFENNYFVTGDYVSAGVTLRGTGVGGTATGTISIPTYAQSPTQGVPAGADIVDAFLYWETLENTPSASSTNGLFNGYSIAGQQIGDDIPNYVDGAFTGTIRAYKADVNLYLPVGANGVRSASGAFTVALPDSGGTGFPLTEGASLVIIYRVLSPNFPLKSVVIYDGAAQPAVAATQLVQGFYDAVGGANGTGKSATLFASGGSWNTSVSSVTLGKSNQYSAPLNAASAYAAVILSTPVNNSDNDGILDAWKTGPAAGDFHAGQPGYYDTKTSTWVGLPGAKHGQKDLFVQLDYMCGAVLANGSCDPTQENLFPSPDSDGNDPLAILQQSFANSGVQLHLEIGNAVPESTCTDNLSTTPVQLCQFPNQPGVVGWKNSLEFSKLYPKNLLSCLEGGDCTTRFPYGQKDSYHYLLVGHSLAIPAWNTRYGTLTSITVANGITTIVTADRGTGINACPSRVTIEGVLGNPTLNGVYNTTSCADTKTITLATPGVPNWTYPNATLPEPVIGLTSGTITSISGYSDLGGADSAVTLGLWLTAPNQDMSKRANVLAGTMFHEIGHTLGLSHGGLYYDTPGSYVPTFEANCKPNYQSIMNYLFQLDGVGPNQAVAFSNQTLLTLNENTAGSVTQLTDTSSNPATFSTSAWYVPYTAGSLASPATLHCDGTPLNGNPAYRVNGPIAPITPAWTNGQDLNYIGVLETQERGYNDLANLDLRQVGATGGEFASLATQLSFGSSVAPLNISAGGNVTLGSGGTVALGSGGTVTLGSGGNVTLGSGGTIALGSGGTVTLGSGGNVTLGSGATVAPGSSGTIALGSGGNVTLGSGGTITLGSGGTITLGSGGTVTLGSGGTIALGSGGAVTIPSTGGSYSIDSNGGTITLGSGGTVTLGSGGNVTLGSGGTIALGSGGTVTLGSGGNVTLGSGGTVTLGSGGTIALGSGGNVTLGSGGTIALGSGGTVTLGSGGNVTLGSGGTVTLGSGGTVALGSGGNVTLGSGGTATLGAGGTVTLGSGGNVTLGSGGTVTLGSGGTVTLGSGGTVTLGSGGAPISVGAGGTVTLGSGGTITLGSGGNITLGSGGTITLGSGGNVTLGSGGVVTLGNNGSVTPGIGSSISLGSVNNITPGSGGPTSTEITYDVANSVVRPPGSPTETSTPAGVRINWKAPAFGVVQTYLIYRSSNGATPILIGSVSGVNGNPPATEFLDTNPDLTSQTVVYTIVTVLVPDTTGGQRQSQQSAPAVLKNDQSIMLGALPSSVVIGSPVTVTATAMSSGAPNGLEVVFAATGACSIAGQSIAGNVSSASVTLNTTGSCTIAASQPGTAAFNAADTVSGTFLILAQGSTTKSQTINFAALPNVQYGNSFTLSASSTSGQQVTFSASGPCTSAGAVTAVGTCSITASVGAANGYSAASLTQSFQIYPAVLKVIAANLSSVYGQAPPSLTYSYSGFVPGDSAAVVTGAPALSTTATAGSNAGAYPITVSTGTLAAQNYSFLYVNGVLTVAPANQAPLTLHTTSPLTDGQSETMSVSGGTTGGLVTYSATGPCTVNGAQLTASSGTGTCLVTATMAGNTNYNTVTSTPANTVTLAKASQTIQFTTPPPANAAYNTTFTVVATDGSGGAVVFTSSGACTNTGGQYKMTSGTGSCSVIANQPGNSNYGPAQQLVQAVLATLATPTVTFTGAPSSAAYQSTFTVASTTNASTTASITSSGACTNSGNTVTMSSGTGTCSLTATWPADSNYAGVTARQSTTATPLAQTIKFTTSPPSTASYPGSFTVAATGGASGNPVTFTSAGSCTVSGATYTLTSGTGTCSVIANQAGNANYSAAPTVTVPVTVTVSISGPTVKVSPTSINFGTLYLGSISTQTVTVTNTGTLPVTVTDPILSIVKGGNSDEFVALSLCPKPLTAGKSCSVTIAFIAGPFYTPQTATLQIMDNAAGSPQTVALSAQVINPRASLSPTALSFGTVKHLTGSTMNVTLSNPGATPLSLTGMNFTGVNAAYFTESNKCGTSVAAGGSCAITVKFTPGAVGTFSANLNIVDNATTGTQTVPLSGKGN
jgi:hypothetical protein